MRTAVAFAALLGCLPAPAQDTVVLRLPGPPPLVLPDWLSPFPRTSNAASQATPTELNASYDAPAPPPDIVAYYEGQLHAAGIAFQTSAAGDSAIVEISAGKKAATVRIRAGNGGARVEVNYRVRRAPPPVLTPVPDPAPPPPVSRNLPPLPLEWPAWLEIPGGRLVFERSRPAGHTVRAVEEGCPGDAVGQPSQGCLQMVFLSSLPVKDLYDYFDGLLDRQGYATHGANPDPDAYPDLGKALAMPVSNLRERQYPVPGEDRYYRQLAVFLGQPEPPATRIEISFLVRNPPRAEGGAAAPRSLSGVWMFTHDKGRLQGAITFKQSGAAVTGTWHTEIGKVEPDSPVAGQIDGNTLYLTRSMGDLAQYYVLTISRDGAHIDGFGDGSGIEHANLNLSPAAGERSPARQR